jgi:hypothetical protein
LSKKHNHHRKQTTSHHTNTPSEIIFTVPVVKILKDALATFEILLQAHANRSIPNLEFAHLTFAELKQKLSAILEREEWGKATALDYNEAWILYASLAMYVVELQLRHEKQRAQLPVCLALCNQFNAIIEAHR